MDHEDPLVINRFYRLDGAVWRYLGPVQGLHVFEDEAGDVVSYKTPPRCEPIETNTNPRRST